MCPDGIENAEGVVKTLEKIVSEYRGLVLAGGKPQLSDYGVSTYGDVWLVIDGAQQPGPRLRLHSARPRVGSHRRHRPHPDLVPAARRRPRCFTAGAATSGAAFSLANAAGRFEQAVASAGAIAGAAADELGLLRDAAIEARLATQFSPTEATQGLQELAAAGFDVRESIGLLRPVLDLAGGLARPALSTSRRRSRRAGRPELRAPVAVQGQTRSSRRALGAARH